MGEVAHAVEDAPPRHARRLDNRGLLAGILIGPAAIFILVLVGGPLLLSLYLSLTDATAGSLRGKFVGARNFLGAIADPNFRRALANTLT
ncbi:MAG: sugar ABC transporter permease, partial [Acidimicrobiales bacterium]